MDYPSILIEANEAGTKALNECTPTPVHFYPADLSGNALGDGSLDYEGNCGGAYIRGINGHDSIVRYFKRYGRQHGSSIVLKLKNGQSFSMTKDVYKGYTLRGDTSFYNGQSHERKKAFYEAFAEVLKDNGIKCGVRDYLT